MFGQIEDDFLTSYELTADFGHVHVDVFELAVLCVDERCLAHVLPSARVMQTCAQEGARVDHAEAAAQWRQARREESCACATVGGAFRKLEFS